MLKKMCYKQKQLWWIYLIIAGILLFADPYFGIFSAMVVILLIIEIIGFIVFKGHYKILTSNQNDSLKLKLFNTEIFGFLFVPIFCTFLGMCCILTLGIANFTEREILAPVYLQVLVDIPLLSDMLLLAAMFSLIFSGVLYTYYMLSHKQKIRQE